MLNWSTGENGPSSLPGDRGGPYVGDGKPDMVGYWEWNESADMGYRDCVMTLEGMEDSEGSRKADGPAWLLDGDMPVRGGLMLADTGDTDISSFLLSDFPAAAAAAASCRRRRYKLGGPLFFGWYSYVHGMPRATQCLHGWDWSSGFSRAHRTLRALQASQLWDWRLFGFISVSD